ncbi:MAG TPA: molybdopterin cofactor-binding domain-containing protein [Desulfosporosinus sp.]|nr:molybdopterin cofactor-binding domain-containing protein [Desulfosporosinus sp.]
MKKRGIGIGCMWYGIGNTGLPNPAGAFVDLMDNGTVNLMVGAADIGQGSNTILAQIVAEVIGVNFEDILVTSADTGVTPDGGATSASRQTYISGNAAHLAAQEVKQVLVEEAAELFGVETEQVTIRDRQVFIKGFEQNCKSIQEVIGGCRKKGRTTHGHGQFNPGTTGLDAETGAGSPYGTYAFATQIVEVEVDTETGQVEVLHIIAAHDVGKAINPLHVEGQIEGGSAMGLGFGLYEEVKTFDGKIKTPSFATYLIPTSMDIPIVYPLIVEEPAGSGPFGAKGVGEPALIPTSAAIANAVFNAVGVRITELPITPERVLAQLRENKSKISRRTN